ncbi:hypothetical protein [Spiroplasma endosymbiont of Othius punctulatus]|uniref:hypothetical protein n=1 Tax=Spiroplasma endosymbiont of Othius punctulatus TaxID=3066289 RepID=UPI0030CE91F6
MPKKKSLKKISWIIMISLPAIYIPSIIAYKTINYLNSGVEVVLDEEIPLIEEPVEGPININDYLGYVDVGPIQSIETKSIIERINLIKNLNFDYTEFNTRIIDNNVMELTVNEASTKYLQSEMVLVEYVLKKDTEVEFGVSETKIVFSLFEKTNIVKFNGTNAHIDKQVFENIFSRKFLKLSPLNEEIELIFSYDQPDRPKNVKATYTGI